MYDADRYDPDRAAGQAEARCQRQHASRLARHPDCGDPDHPGCPACDEEA